MNNHETQSKQQLAAHFEHLKATAGQVALKEQLLKEKPSKAEAEILKEAGPVVSATDFIYAYRFLSKLVTPFKKTDAYKLGIIDEDGNILKTRDELHTRAEKDAFTYLDLLICNLKKQLKKYSPLVYKRTTPNIVAAMTFMLKEHYQMRDSVLVERLTYCWLKRGCPEGNLRGLDMGQILSETSELNARPWLGRPGFVYGFRPTPEILKCQTILKEEAVTSTGPSGLGGIGGNPGNGSAIAGYDSIGSTKRVNKYRRPVKRTKPK